MGMSYLAKEKVRRDVSRTTSPHSEEVEIDSLELRLSAEEIQEEQNTILQHQLDRNVHIYDYHVVYSTSYAAPVLYFRGYQEGRQESSFYQSSNLHQTGNRLDGTRFGTIFRMLIVTKSNDGTSLHNKYEVSSCVHLILVLLAGTSSAGLSLLFHSSMRDFKTNATCTAYPRSWS